MKPLLTCLMAISQYDRNRKSIQKGVIYHERRCFTHFVLVEIYINRNCKQHTISTGEDLQMTEGDVLLVSRQRLSSRVQMKLICLTIHYHAFLRHL